MRKSFAAVPAPMLAGVVKERTPREAIARIRNCECHGATGIDLHVSCLADEYKNVDSIRTIVNACRLPILALHYKLAHDGSSFECTEEERTALLMTAIEAGAAAADMQGYTFDLPSKAAFRSEFAHLGYSFIKNNPREVVLDEAVIARQMDFIEKIHRAGAEVLLSNHTGVPMTAEELVDLALFVEKRNPDIIKIVTPADTEEQMAEAIRAMVLLKREVKTPVSYHCSGKFGGITRLVNPALGGFMCFCNDTFTANSDMNQPMLEVAKAGIESLLKVK